MNKLKLQSIALGLFAALVSLPLYAQTTTPVEEDDTIAKVETNEGVIMLSEDGEEFDTALPDERVKPKARLMVSEDSSATVVYDNGCDKTYDEPGVYELSKDCVVPLVLVSSGATKGWVLAGTVIGGGAIALLINHDHDPRPPVSR